MRLTVALGLALLVAAPASAQAPHVYTKADIGKDLDPARPEPPADELVWIRAHAFVAPVRAPGPTAYVIPSDPIASLPQITSWPAPLDPNWVPVTVYTGWPLYGYDGGQSWYAAQADHIARYRGAHPRPGGPRPQPARFP
jgi:hypothetical protein